MSQLQASLSIRVELKHKLEPILNIFASRFWQTLLRLFVFYVPFSFPREIYFGKVIRFLNHLKLLTLPLMLMVPLAHLL